MSDAELSGALVATLSPEAAQRKAAEAFLSSLEAKPGFAIHLLQMVQQHCTSVGPQSSLIRAAAAVYFKNVVKRAWEAPADGEAPKLNMATQDREAIKAHMVKVVVACGHVSEVQHQLSAALSIISKADFPAKWPNLLPELIKELEGGDMRTVKGMLLTANSILKRFRDVYKSDDLYRELKYVLDLFAAPLTACFHKLGAWLAEKADEREVLEALRLVARVFYSLNWQDLPEFFEDHMAEWMGAFEKYLLLEVPSSVNDEDEDAEDPLEPLQCAIVENVSLYASKYEDEFGVYVPGFATAIWGRLMKTSNAPKHDALAATAIRFLAGIVGKQMHASLFADPATLRQIVEAIVVPNMSLRDADVEVFEENPFDYVAADFESADADTRRRGARDLVSAMCKNHEAAATQICGEHVARMLAGYAADKDNQWRAKDCALALIVAVTVRAESAHRGVSQTSKHLDVNEVFQAHVLPELEDLSDLSARPVIRADCIQFACTFRNQLPPPTLVALLPLLCAHMRAPSQVVQTYAAACLERVLAMQGAVTRQEVGPLLGPLFEALFAVLDDGQSEFTENEYVMKAVMRLLVTADADVLPVAAVIIDKLTVSRRTYFFSPTNLPGAFSSFGPTLLACLLAWEAAAGPKGGTRGGGGGPAGNE